MGFFSVSGENFREELFSGGWVGIFRLPSTPSTATIKEKSYFLPHTTYHQTTAHTTTYHRTPPYTSTHQRPPPHTTTHQHTPPHTSAHQHTPPHTTIQHHTALHTTTHHHTQRIPLKLIALVIHYPTILLSFL